MPAIGSALIEIADRFPDREALIHVERGVRLSYRQFIAAAGRAAAGLKELGIGPGDHVAIWGGNRPEWIVSQAALSILGAVWTPIDPSAAPGQLAFVLEHSDAVAVIADQNLREVLEAARSDPKSAGRLKRLQHVVSWEEPAEGETGWAEVLEAGRAGDPAELAGRVDESGPAAIMYTSGTTGRPKGAMLAHQSLITKSLAAAERQALTETDRLGLFFPLSHMFGNTCIALTGLLRGAALVIPADVFEPGSTLTALARERCTAVYGTPSMLIAILDHPNFGEHDLSSLRTGILGGAACPLEIVKRIVEVMGVREITLGYGLTETSSWVTMTQPDDPLELRVGTVGTALAGCEVGVFDPDTDEPLAPGIGGEIRTRGSLMLGYYKQAQATARAIDADGWYRTGDLGTLDETGRLRVTGRIKDVVVRRGVEILPAQVEDEIYRLESVAEVQVFGVPDVEVGRRLAAWLRLKPGASLTEADVLAFCRAELEPDLVPDLVRFVDSFPTTPSGKVQKYKLAELALAELQDDYFFKAGGRRRPPSSTACRDRIAAPRSALEAEKG